MTVCVQGTLPPVISQYVESWLLLCFKTAHLRWWLSGYANSFSARKGLQHVHQRQQFWGQKQWLWKVLKSTFEGLSSSLPSCYLFIIFIVISILSICWAVPTRHVSCEPNASHANKSRAYQQFLHRIPFKTECPPAADRSTGPTTQIWQVLRQTVFFTARPSLTLGQLQILQAPGFTVRRLTMLMINLPQIWRRSGDIIFV